MKELTNNVHPFLCFLLLLLLLPERAPKRHKGGAGGGGAEEEEEEDDDTEDMETEMGLFGRRKPGTRPKGPPPPGANKKTQQQPQQPASTSTSASSSSSSNPELRVDGNSVFISNLAYTLAEPEQKLRALFERCGPVAQVRPVFSKAGGFKGYGYLQFESEASVSEALKLDRREVEGRPMFVSPCVDKNANPDFKVNAGAGDRPWDRLLSAYGAVEKKID